MMNIVAWWPRKFVWVVKVLVYWSWLGFYIVGVVLWGRGVVRPWAGLVEALLHHNLWFVRIQ